MVSENKIVLLTFKMNNFIDPWYNGGYNCEPYEEKNILLESLLCKSKHKYPEEPGSYLKINENIFSDSNIGE